MAPLLLYLGNAFPVQTSKPSNLLFAFAVIPSALFLSAAYTPLLVPGITIEGHSAQPNDLGLLYTLQSLYIAGSFIACIVMMLRKRKHVNSRQRAQIMLFMTGLLIGLLVNVVTGIFLTMLNQSTNFSNLAGALSFFALVATTSYAIVRYRLFDIRLAITRVIGYSITIGVVAAFYSLLIVLIGTKLTSFNDIDAKDLTVLLLPTIFIALTFHYVERFVAKHTQRLFYRDAYNEREVLDKLSDALITENDINTIMEQSLTVLGDALKPRTAYLAVLNASGTVYHQAARGSEEPVSINALLGQLKHEKQMLIDIHENPTSSIARIMAQGDAEILLRLGTPDKPAGLLLLGTKQNGSMYTTQDVALLRICAKSLSLSLENAKKFEQILHFADTMHSEVKRATSRLRKANKELKTLDALKDDFIATASHQLRTPAASVHDALRMLNHPMITKKDRDELIEMAEASSEHLVTVVRTMLNMARLQAGHFTIDKSNTDLVLLTERVIDQVEVLASRKNSRITLLKPDHPVRLNVDVAKINEALSNYIENAIKYSPEHSTVTVDLAVTADKIIFEITDQGMGVPLAEQPNLFGKFYRATNARQEQPDGNGIGLYVVKSIAEGHGGEAYYRPATEQGSVFGFWLPVTSIKT
jgi:signal transduction histidine kinase